MRPFHEGKGDLAIGAPPSHSHLFFVVATVTLGLARGRSLGAVMQTFTAAIGDVASMLLVIAGSGAFKEALLQSGVSGQIGTMLESLPVDPLILARIVAGGEADPNTTRKGQNGC